MLSSMCRPALCNTEKKKICNFIHTDNFMRELWKNDLHFLTVSSMASSCVFPVLFDGGSLEPVN